MSETNRQHEVDRLRLLLQKATGARKALIVEIEPSARGFQIIATGISAEHEMEAAQTIAQYLNVLLKGAVRFTVSALDHMAEDRWQGGDELMGTIRTLATSPDAHADVPAQPEPVVAVDPVPARSDEPTPREK